VEPYLLEVDLFVLQGIDGEPSHVQPGHSVSLVRDAPSGELQVGTNARYVLGITRP